MLVGHTRDGRGQAGRIHRRASASNHRRERGDADRVVRRERRRKERARLADRRPALGEAAVAWVVDCGQVREHSTRIERGGKGAS